MEYSKIHQKWFKTQEDIDNDEKAFMHQVKESNKDMCDNCDLNSCHGCIGE
jgi:hypothetical protein